MKKLILIYALVIAGIFSTETKANYGEVNFNFFYHNLNSYGEWIEVDYDVIVWRPYNISRSWSPYSVGNWEYTRYGWYWNSYEPFGWATYHYGRWYYDDFYGWVWVPGYEWGPSWVEWRYSDNYIGWSPLPPYAEFRLRVGIYFSINYRTSYHHWNFVTYNRFCHRNVHSYFVGPSYKNRIFNNTKYRTNYYADRGRIINGGIDRNYIERRSGSRVVEREIRNTTDLRDYTGSRGNVNNDRVIAYQPDQRELQKFRDADVKGIKRAEGKSSLKREAITFRNEEPKTREVLRREQSDQREITRNAEKRNEQVSITERSQKPVVKENRTAPEVKRTNPVQQRTIDRTENKSKPEVRLQETRRIDKPSQPVKRNETRINSPQVNSSKKSTSINRSGNTDRSSKVSKPVSSKREESKSSPRNTPTKKKRN
jgi:hypothetical protein